MARGKKKEKELTPEEKLQQALVPVDEQPYGVPENWCWVKLDGLVSITTGKKDANYGCDGGKYAFFTCAAEALRCNGYSFDGESLLLPGNGANVGQVYYYNGKFEAYQRTYVLQSKSKTDNLRYLYYHILGFWKEYNRDKQFGSATNYIKLGNFLNYKVPLAPLPEQQRIVDRIESLFAKLDEVKEKAQVVVDGFEDRKTAILHKAFTGELTEGWRNSRGINFNNWKRVTLQSVCEKITCGKTPKEYIQKEGEIPYLKVYNIVNNSVDFESNPQYIPTKIHSGRLSSSILKPNDVIMNIVGPPLRKIAIIPDTYEEWNMNQAIVRFRPKEMINHRFLYYSLINPETLDSVIKETRGVVGQANISVTQSRNLSVPLPTIEEQLEIVRILDDVLQHEKDGCNLSLQVIDQTEKMKKGILARAFRGELGTNDPSEESAEKLLKQIL